MLPKKNIEKVLKSNKGYRRYLFDRGYLITNNDTQYDLQEFPFYNNWNKCQVGAYTILNHIDTKVYKYEVDEKTLVLIGHAYDPFSNITEEDLILRSWMECYNQGMDKFWEKVSQVTGAFIAIMIDKNNAFAFQDAVGLKTLFYGEIKNKMYLSSHAQLVADINELEMCEEIRRLVDAPFYKIGIRHLPGIKSSFKEIKALTANTYLDIARNKVERFYPNRGIKLKSEEVALQEIESILVNSMKLCKEKWKPSISLTGGVDSKMTLAAGKGNYDNYTYFSFHSTEAEKKDAIAASNICRQLGLHHTIYDIPRENEKIKDLEIYRSIIDHNGGYTRVHKDSEIRKIAFLSKHSNIETEIKSHISEIGRAFYYKKLGKTSMPNPLKKRHMSNLYKRNMFDRKTLKYMDEAFKEFVDVTKFDETFGDKFDSSDMFYWEHRMSRWASNVKQDFDICHETTVIYNNRKLLEIFMSFKLEDRIADKPQKELINKLNKQLYELNINNNNAMKDKKRILLERIFFEVNSII